MVRVHATVFLVSFVLILASVSVVFVPIERVAGTTTYNFHLFYSSDTCGGDTYCIRYANCSTPNGTYTPGANNPLIVADDFSFNNTFDRLLPEWFYYNESSGMMYLGVHKGTSGAYWGTVTSSDEWDSTKWGNSSYMHDGGNTSLYPTPGLAANSGGHGGFIFDSTSSEWIMYHSQMVDAQLSYGVLSRGGTNITYPDNPMDVNFTVVNTSVEVNGSASTSDWQTTDIDIGYYNGSYYLLASNHSSPPSGATREVTAYVNNSGTLFSWNWTTEYFITHNGEPRATYPCWLLNMNNTIATYDDKFWILYSWGDGSWTIRYAWRNVSDGIIGTYTDGGNITGITGSNTHNPVWVLETTSEENISYNDPVIESMGYSGSSALNNSSVMLGDFWVNWSYDTNATPSYHWLNVSNSSGFGSTYLDFNETHANVSAGTGYCNITISTVSSSTTKRYVRVRSFYG